MRAPFRVAGLPRGPTQPLVAVSFVLCSLSEMQVALKALNLKIPRDQLEKLMVDLDEDHTGQLSVE